MLNIEELSKCQSVVTEHFIQFYTYESIYETAEINTNLQLKIKMN